MKPASIFKVALPALAFLLVGGGALEWEARAMSVNTHLVTVSLIATGQRDEQIEDLKRTNFVLTEDGKPQQIAVFLFRKPDDEGYLPPVPAVKPAPGPGNAVVQWPPQEGLEHRRLLAMLFDFSDMAAPEQLNVRTSAIRFIREAMKPADLVTVMSATKGTLEVVQDFTDDRKALEAAVASIGITGPERPEFDLFNGDRKLKTIEAACKGLSGYSHLGAKGVLYFSAEYPHSGVDNQAVLTNTINRCMDSNAAIYPIGRSQAVLSKLATDTGGTPFPESGNLTSAIAAARDMIGSHYVLGYYSTNSRPDGAYRIVNVKMNRADASQLKLDYRHGYFAEKEFARSLDEDEWRRTLNLANPVTEIPLAVEVDYFAVAPNRYRIPVTVKIPGSEIALARSINLPNSEWEFRIRITPKNGDPLPVISDKIRLSLDTGETPDQLRSRPLTRTIGLTLPPGSFHLTLIAREAGTRRMGTFETDIEIPDLQREVTNIRTSSLLLGSERHPDRGTGWPLPSDDGAPGVNYVLPSVTRVFGKSHTLYADIEVYGAPLRIGGLATAMLTLSLNGNRMFESAPLKLDNSAPRQTLPVRFDAPLSSLPAGVYDCQVVFVDSTGHTAGSRSTEIRVVEEQTPPPLLPLPMPTVTF